MAVPLISHFSKKLELKLPASPVAVPKSTERVRAACAGFTMAIKTEMAMTFFITSSSKSDCYILWDPSRLFLCGMIISHATWSGKEKRARYCRNTLVFVCLIDLLTIKQGLIVGYSCLFAEFNEK